MVFVVDDVAAAAAASQVCVLCWRGGFLEWAKEKNGGYKMGGGLILIIVSPLDMIPNRQTDRQTAVYDSIGVVFFWLEKRN